jgi:hypothetical protein
MVVADATYWVRMGESKIEDQQSDSTETGRNDGLPCHNNVAHYPLPNKFSVSLRKHKKGGQRLGEDVHDGDVLRGCVSKT